MKVGNKIQFNERNKNIPRIALNIIRQKDSYHLSFFMKGIDLIFLVEKDNDEDMNLFKFEYPSFFCIAMMYLLIQISGHQNSI